MVFLIQQSANKDSVALHLKLNELLASNKRANNQLIGIEDATEDELRKLAAAYLQLVEKHDASSELTGDDGVAAEIARRLADARATDSAESQTNDAT